MRVILRLTDSICSIAVNLKINKSERCFSELRAAHQLCRREKNETFYLILATRAAAETAVLAVSHTPYHKHTPSRANAPVSIRVLICLKIRLLSGRGVRQLLPLFLM